MVFGMYRQSTIGIMLTETLDEMVASGKLDPELAIQVQLQFDEAMNAALEHKVTSSATIKGNLHTYRYCDSVWTFILRDVKFRSVEVSENIDKLKIVACDSKLMKPKVPPQQ